MAEEFYCVICSNEKAEPAGAELSLPCDGNKKEEEEMCDSS